MREQIQKLQKKMEENHIDAYLVMTDDFHGSEYVGDYFKCREYLSGFTGSAGRMVVTKKQAVLWTDGRYFIQAEEELLGSGIELYKMGEPGVLNLLDFLKNTMEEGMVLGCDGRTINAMAAQNMEKVLKRQGVRIRFDCDLAGEIWKNRPERSHKPLWILETLYAGESREDKIERIRRVLNENQCDSMLVTSLDEVAWLFNIRGNDVEYNPVALAYGVVFADETQKALLFCDDRAVSGEVEKELKEIIQFCPYDEIEDYVNKLPQGHRLMLDISKVNATLCRAVSKNVIVKNVISPIMEMKAVKNQTEMENERIAHIKDGVALTKLIYWVKHAVKEMEITELEVVRKIETFRRADEHYVEPSFATISAYASNAAIVHYEPAPESDKILKAEGLLLVDTGGHYLEGTTDVTRTIVLGELSAQQKLHYTAVLKGNLKLADTVFLHGCRGANLDCIAREPLWKMGLDFKHGTGHGVGYLLNVHETPNSFRWKINPKQLNSQDVILEEGMITSDEPGIYFEGQYGIRLENLLLCKKEQQNEFGQFMKFETLTMVPFDRQAIDITLLGEEDKDLLNAYHQKVYEMISPYLTEEERNWLREETRAL